MPTVCEIMSERYGDDWQNDGPTHVFDIENNYRTDFRDLMVIRGAKDNDAHGYNEVIDVANYRALCNFWDGVEAFDNRGPYMNVDVITLDVLLEGPEDLPEVLESLSDYPVLSDEFYSEVERETIEEHWEMYGEDELHDVIAEKLGGHDRGDLTDAAKDIINELVWSDILDFWPSMIDVSAVDFGESEVADWFEGRVGRVVTLPSRYREAVTFDLRINNLLEV